MQITHFSARSKDPRRFKEIDPEILYVFHVSIPRPILRLFVFPAKSVWSKEVQISQTFLTDQTLCKKTNQTLGQVFARAHRRRVHNVTGLTPKHCVDFGRGTIFRRLV